MSSRKILEYFPILSTFSSENTIIKPLQVYFEKKSILNFLEKLVLKKCVLGDLISNPSNSVGHWLPWLQSIYTI